MLDQLERGSWSIGVLKSSKSKRRGVPALELLSHPKHATGELRSRDRKAVNERPTPELGQNTDEIPSGLGHDATSIADLRTRGVV